MEALNQFSEQDLPGLYMSHASPGTPMDLEGKCRVGWDLYVLRLRFNGVYLTRDLLQRRPRHFGMALSVRESRGNDTWLVDRKDPMRLLIQALQEAHVLRRRESGALLLRGMEFDEGELQAWPQTWICAANPTEIDNIVREMEPWLRARYEAIKRPPYPVYRPR
ncbi:hypothetical protein ACCQ08_25455 [Comamonas sp. SY3]|uniref:hypothetical protein n=1 Tax=Comamonas sp. SY3 TaxID=3243601 RepID=UPI0035939842